MRKTCSIITVNLDNKKGLEKTIRSVAAQIFDNFEYIIIDGASKDGSVEVIEQDVDRVDKWISEPDSGVYEAMNKGIAMASGEYLLFLNSGDTLLEETTLQRAAQYLEPRVVDIVYGDLRFDSGKSYNDFHYPDKLTFEFMYNRSLGHPAVFIRKSLFDCLGGYEELYPICADWVFFTKAICLHNATYQHIPFVVANFLTNGMSSLAENIQRIKNEREKALNGPFKYLTESHEKYLHLKKQMDALRRSKPYRLFKFIGLSKYK